MIINSDFKDYYDVISKQFRDPKTVFERHQSIKHKDQIDEKCAAIINKYCYGEYDTENGIETIEALCFCGKVYPFAVIRDIDCYTRSYVWNDVYKNLRTIYKYKRRWYYFHKYPEEYEGGGIEDPTAIEIASNISPIVLCSGWPKCKIMINPKLLDINFPMHPYQAFQEIAMFINSVNPHIPDMSDKNKLESHGFDKDSFKREPGGPTRKRKKLHQN